VISLFSTASVQQHPDGYALVNIMGETRQYVEIAPGLFQGRLDPDDRVALRMDEDGQAYLQPPIPFTFIKSPWYATSTFHGLILLLGLVLFLAAVVGWPLKAVTAGRERTLQPRLARLARWTAAAFGLLLLVLVIGLVTILGNIDPAYGVPMVFFGVAEGLDVLLLFPYVLALSGLGVVVFAVLAWAQGWWTVRARLFYNLLALAVVGLLWQMAFWKLWL
jgi:hypothetical protein